MEDLYKYNIKINPELIFRACANFIERVQVAFKLRDRPRKRKKHIHFKG
jgi:hypothetical protein